MRNNPGRFRVFVSFVCCCFFFLLSIITAAFTIRSCIRLDFIEAVALGSCAAISAFGGVKLYKQFESSIPKSQTHDQQVNDRSQRDTIEENQLPVEYDQKAENSSADTAYTFSTSYQYRPPAVISQGNIRTISDTEMVVLLRYYHKVDEIKTKVKGVSYRNNDGTDRQSILAHCHAGDQLQFTPYTYKGAPAYAVYCDWGQIGNLSADLAEEIADEIAARKNPCLILGEILNVSGGYHGEYFGCNICVSIYEKNTATH